MLMRSTSLTVLILLAMAGNAQAQGAVPSPPSSAFNWLNLQRQGNSTAANYYQLVRPYNQTQNALMNLQQDYSNLNRSVTESSNTGANDGIRVTGHAATYMNYGRYYPNARGSMGGGRPGGAPGRR